MRRDLPWREPAGHGPNRFYRIWLSEIMLQQTRAAAVIPYYLGFLERFPSLESLAAAGEPEVLSAWSGLGYYSRARNLRRAAQLMASSGVPATHDGILALPGIGPYTAAAVASIALGLPHAAVDGNVLRVVSRLMNDAAEVTAPATRARFSAIAGELLDARRPGDFNQAMMELGATVCVPRAPQCGACPVARFCAARAAGTERQLPVRKPKPETSRVRLEVALVIRRGRIWLLQRAADESRLAGFWELPEKRSAEGWGADALGRFSHRIVNHIFEVAVFEATAVKEPGGRWFGLDRLDTIPLSTVTRKALAFTRAGAAGARSGVI